MNITVGLIQTEAVHRCNREIDNRVFERAGESTPMSTLDFR
jgi:hypothetical protein